MYPQVTVSSQSGVFFQLNIRSGQVLGRELINCLDLIFFRQTLVCVNSSQLRYARHVSQLFTSFGSISDIFGVEEEEAAINKLVWYLVSEILISSNFQVLPSSQRRQNINKSKNWSQVMC